MNKKNLVKMLSLITLIVLFSSLPFPVTVQADTQHEQTPVVQKSHLAASGADAKSIYVSKDGSDTTGDGTEANPYQTIKYACAHSSANDTVLLLTDIEQREMVGIWHNLTIDGQNHSVTRQAGILPVTDAARTQYNPAMFETHSDAENTTITFKNITLDDNFLHEGTKYQDQALKPPAGSTDPDNTADNINRVQDGIIALYDSNKTTVVLEDGCTLKNFGGFTAVNIEGNSELIMKAGSVITNDGIGTNANASAVYPLSGGTLTMEAGSLITGISGSFAVFTNGDQATRSTANINGEISNCSGGTPLRTVHSDFNIGTSANIHDLTGGTAALYDVGDSVVTVSGKFTDMSGVGLYPSCNSGVSTIKILKDAEIARCGQMAVQTNLGSKIYMNGGSIHDNPIGIHNRKQSSVYVSGGKIYDNQTGIQVNKKSTTTARVFVTENADVTGNNTTDYYIEATATGYTNGSYIYYDDVQAEKEPAIKMELNDKLVTVKSSNKQMHIGNASAASKTALANEATRLGLSNQLATWWFDNDQNPAEFLVTGLSPNTEPLFALYVPVNADGTVAGDVYCIKVTPDILANLSTSANEDGYSVMLVQADVPTYTITIDYTDDSGSTLRNAYTEEFVKGSNYDLSALTSPAINGYYFDSVQGDPVGTANNDRTITSIYKAVKELVVEANTDEVTYDGKYHDLSGFKQLVFTIDGEEYTVSGLQTAALHEKDYAENGYELVASGTPVVKDSHGTDVTSKFNVKVINGLLTIKRAAVTVTADNKTKKKGESDPKLTASVAGLAKGDSVKYTLTRKAGETAGKYAITPQGERIQGNYTVKYIDGTLTIKKDKGDPGDEGDEKDSDKNTGSSSHDNNSGVDTGDASGIMPWVLLLLASLTGMTALLLLDKFRAS